MINESIREQQHTHTHTHFAQTDKFRQQIKGGKGSGCRYIKEL